MIDKQSPLAGLDPAGLLKQGMAEDTFADGAPSSFIPPQLEELAAIFPQFEILELIGQGGMGAVYKVRQKDLDRIVALKILPPAIGRSPEFSARFTREARALAKLNHPGIVTLHEFGQTSSSQLSTINSQPLYFILMEFVDGVNLAQLMKTGRVSPREALAIVPQICEALQYAHDQGIVHRDIKPENILLDRLGRVKVADFGIAKVVAAVRDPITSGDTPVSENQTLAGKIIGTPAYMAPEQIDHPSDVDHRADIYALGVVFYQMLTGELPGKRLEAPSKKVHIDVRLDEIVLKAMEKNPELRFQQASVMKTRVDDLGLPQVPSGPRAVKSNSTAQQIAIGCGVLGLVGILLMVALVTVSLLFTTKKHEVFESQLKETRQAEANSPERGGPIPAEAANLLAGIKTIHEEPDFRGKLESGKRDEMEQVTKELARRWNRLRELLKGTGGEALIERHFDLSQKMAEKSMADGTAPDHGMLAELQQLDAELDRIAKRTNVSKTASMTVNASTEPPQLRALDWQDRLEDCRPSGDAWLPSGEPLVSPGGMPAITFVVDKTEAAMDNPRFLCLWFSHPHFDKQSMVEIKLLDSEGKQPLKTPTGNFAISAIPASPENADTGWITAALCAGKKGEIPPGATVFLRYSVGTWQFWNDIAPDFNGTQALGTGVMMNRPAQGADGHAFIQITRDSSQDTGVEQFGFVAITRDGRRLETTGYGKSSSGKVTIERFPFDAPLAQVKSFECRKRPVHQMTWSVVLKESPDTLQDQAGPDAGAMPARAVVASAEAWLAGIDAGNYAQSWKDAAKFFQTSITEAAWSEALKKFRKPLGEMKSRKLLDAKSEKSLPGAPDGEYVVMQFETSFAAKERAVETVTFMREPDGTWKAAGYFIK